MNVARLWRRALDQFSIYLPVALMGVLALGTYWLVKNSPVPAEAQAERPVRHEADYFLRQFAVKTFDNSGRLKSEVRGRELRHFPDSDTVEIDAVRIQSFDDQGRLTTATANRALSNSDGTQVRLMGQARVVREAVDGSGLPRLEFRGEFLDAFLNEEKVRSHLPVELLRGADRFTADTLAYDNVARVAQLQGRVRGLLAPRERKSAR